jgi:uncharacterized protein YjbI with pentapeptide repeats
MAVQLDLGDADINDCTFTDVTAPGSVFRNAVMTSVRAERADLSRCDFLGVSASASTFARATFWRSILSNGRFTDCSFEFADLRSAEAVGTDFRKSSFVGAHLSGARLYRCDLREADFYWADLAGCHLVECDTQGARFPEPVRRAYGPAGTAPPRVVPRPPYRIASEEEWGHMPSSSRLVADQEAQDDHR